MVEFPENYDGGTGVMWVSLAWLLQNTTSSVDFDSAWDLGMDETDWWLEMMETKCSDTGFGHLVDSIATHGFLEQGSIGWWQGQITEGHHRLMAAILLGLDEVPISPFGGSLSGPLQMSAHDNLEDPYPIDVGV